MFLKFFKNPFYPLGGDQKDHSNYVQQNTFSSFPCSENVRYISVIQIVIIVLQAKEMSSPRNTLKLNLNWNKKPVRDLFHQIVQHQFRGLLHFAPWQSLCSNCQILSLWLCPVVLQTKWVKQCQYLPVIVPAHRFQEMLPGDKTKQKKHSLFGLPPYICLPRSLQNGYFQ